uniref:Glycine cleavage system protein H n=1 Tax=candidate division WOR-3 bacterium TaxID=2052148 RepID=A0A7C2P3C2_UNCW3
MELYQYQWVDFFATKGLKYLLILGFWLALFPFWRLLMGPARRVSLLASRVWEAFSGWFNFPQTLYYHQGHTWAKLEDGLVKVGLDDFAQKLLGRPEAIELPLIGGKVKQGDIGWRMKIEGRTLEMLSPVSGEVLAINKKVLEDPGLILKDPYGEGWLLKVEPDNLKVELRNLLRGESLKGWIQGTIDRLRGRLGGELGLMYQDGGLPVSGFVRMIDPQNWDQIAREFLIPER